VIDRFEARTPILDVDETGSATVDKAAESLLATLAPPMHGSDQISGVRLRTAAGCIGVIES